MTSTSGSPSGTFRHLIDFPNVLPAGVHVDVPRPVENHPDWTSVPYTHADIPPMFDELVIMPDSETEPALYAAAVDTIRMTNTYFELTGSYSSEHSRTYPLTRDLVMEKQVEWPGTTDEDGNEEELDYAENCPEPPDLRTLFVKEDMGDPTDEKLRPLWFTAYKKLIDQANAREPHDDAWLVLEIFKRYLVWHELCHEASNRATRFEQKQPTWNELQDFFNREDVKKEGATLVEICHAFPRARDAKMLVYRIEHFATLEPQPSEPMDAGVEDPVESRYMFRSPPSSQSIEEATLTLLRHQGSSVSLKELADQYLPSRVHDRLFRDVLDRLRAHRNMTTGRFVLPGNEPPLEKMESTFEQERSWHLNGIGLQRLATLFRHRIGDGENFLEAASDSYFFDDTEQLYFPLYEDDENGGTLSPERSLIARDNARIRMSIERGNLVWDRRLLSYVPRVRDTHPGEIAGIGGHSFDLGSPTDTIPDTVAGETPLPEPANAMGRITAWEIEPTSPRAEASTPLAPASGASHVRAPPGPPVEEVAARMPPLVAEPEITGQGRKRGPTEEFPESSRGKKARKAPKIRCFRKTLMNTRCKKQKDRNDEEDEWDCGVHKQS